MSLDNVEAYVSELLDAASDQHAANRCLAPLVLAYAAIDILGSLERLEGEGTRKSFVRWADRYLLPHSDLPCSAIDLYAARCGLLHSLTPEADLVKRGEARRIGYAWGSGRDGDIREMSRRLKRDVIGIHVTSLITAIREGLHKFLVEVRADDERRRAVESRSGKWFAQLPIEQAIAFLERTGGRSPAA